MPVNRFVAGLAPTPAVRSGQPRTHTRKCGNQPAHQSLITDVLQVPPLPLRDYLTVPLLEAVLSCAQVLDCGHQSGVWPPRFDLLWDVA
jgi:hypothetical protein